MSILRYAVENLGGGVDVVSVAKTASYMLRCFVANSTGGGKVSNHTAAGGLPRARRHMSYSRFVYDSNITSVSVVIADNSSCHEASAH